MKKVGLSGGVACGKSAVAELFRQFGVPIIDADEIARALTQQNAPQLAQIVETFGNTILDSKGTLDRQQLRDLIFRSAQHRQQLEQILHPPIRKAIEEQVEQIKQTAVPYCIIVIPLLIESRMQDLVDRIVIVDCSPATQLHRLMQRDDCTEEQAHAIIASQCSREERIAAAHEVIDNDQDADHLAQQVQQLHLALGKEPTP